MELVIHEVVDVHVDGAVLLVGDFAHAVVQDDVGSEVDGLELSLEDPAVLGCDAQDLVDQLLLQLGLQLLAHPLISMW